MAEETQELASNDQEQLFKPTVIFDGVCRNHNLVYRYTDIDKNQIYQCVSCPMGEIRSQNASQKV